MFEASFVKMKSGQNVEELRRAAFKVSRVKLDDLAEHQFPDIFFSSKGRQIKRPNEWRVSEMTRAQPFG